MSAGTKITIDCLDCIRDRSTALAIAADLRSRECQVQELDILHGVCLENSMAKELSRSLADSKSVGKIAFRGSMCEILARVFLERSHMEELRCVGCRWTEVSACLRRGTGQLKKLAINCSEKPRISPDDLEELRGILRGSAVQELDLSSSPFANSAAVETLARCIQSADLAAVSLSCCGLDDQGAFAIANLVANNAVLQRLDLSDNPLIGHLGHDALLEGMKMNTQLKQVLVGGGSLHIEQGLMINQICDANLLLEQFNPDTHMRCEKLGQIAKHPAAAYELFRKYPAVVGHFRYCMQAGERRETNKN